MPIKGFYYDEQKRDVLGSDGYFTCDGRYSKATAIAKAKRDYRKQLEAHKKDKRYIRPKGCYLRLFRGEIRDPHYYTDYIDLR